MPDKQYEKFEALGENYYFRDPINSDAHSEFTTRVPLYVGVPPHIEPDDLVDDGYRFCSLGQHYGHLFLTVETVVSRIDQKVRFSDYEILKNNAAASPFQVWDKNARFTGTPRFLLLDPSNLDNRKSFDNREAWDNAQWTIWKNVITSVSKATPPTPFNVYTRFIEPPLGITLIFTPAEKPVHLSIAQLDTAIKLAFEDTDLKLPKYTYHVVEWSAAAKAGAHLVGHHYLYLYYTWMFPEDYKNIWAWAKTPDLARPWPNNQVIVDNTDAFLNGGKPGGGGVTTTCVQMSDFKVTGAIGMRANFPGQKTVMGASATEIAVKFWAGNTLTAGKRPADAEWLHRNAFHFGGLVDDRVDLASSQQRANLVFGTGECNTNMIRAENAITTLLAADAKASQNDKRTGTLTTTNVRSGSVTRINARGEQKVGTIPLQQEYMWLCLALKYDWDMTCPDLNATFNVSMTFDPFSRYIPLRVEARLDDVIMKYLTSGALKSAMPANTPPIHNAGIVSHAMIDSVAEVDERPTTVTSVGLPAGRSTREPMLAWYAAIAQLPSVTIHNVKISNPTVGQSLHAVPLSSRVLASVDAADDPEPPEIPPLPIPALPNTLPPTTGFILKGEIALFGNPELVAQFEVWQGPPPPGIIIGRDPPIFERATLKRDFHLSLLVPDLRGTAFDKIIFRNVTFFHQNYRFDATKTVGWHINADWVIDESCGLLHQLLSKFLGVKDPTLSLHAGLGVNQDWSRDLAIHSFTLDGVFAGLNIRPFDGIHLTRIGVRLLGIRAMRFAPEPRSILEYGFGVFGTMDLDVPGSVVPLQLDYEIREAGSVVRLAAEVSGAIWKDPIGIKGLTLSNVMFTTSLSITEPWNSFQFDVAAAFQYKSTGAIFSGSYASGGAFELTATLQKFDVNSISHLFDFISRNTISIPEVDIKVGSATISIASGKALSINLQNVEIAGHTAVNASLAINPTGVLLRGDLDSNAISFGDVELKKAFLQVRFETVDSGKQTDLIIGGEVAFSSLTFDAAVHLYPAAGGSKGIEWTILAALTVGDNSLALSRVVPEVKGSKFLDLSLRHVVFVAASRDDPSIGQMITSGYSFHQGVQICATLDPVDSLNSVMRAPVPGLILSAGWSKATGFELDILLPSPTTLSLGKGVSTTPIKLQLQTKPLNFILSAGLKVPVPNSPEPLFFSLSLAINFESASAASEMVGVWVNPFGISPHVSIANLLLSIEIIYKQFALSGTPSGFGVRGGLSIGKTQAQFACQVSEDPMREMLLAKLERLNISDLVSFAGELLDVSIPQPPSNFLDFEKLELYICPTGMTLKSITYPQGFSFTADMVLFGKRANVACAVGGTEITIKGGVDNFELGPLSVHGSDGPRATIDCKIGPSSQHVLIDGVASFFDALSAVHVEVDALPKPKFLFHTVLKFTDLLTFQLGAELIGAVSFDHIQDADFAFTAKLEQHILEYIREQVMEQFDKARQVADEGIRTAQSRVNEAEKTLGDGIRKAQAELDAAYTSWDAKNKEVTKASNHIIDAYHAEISKRQAEVDKARVTYNAALQNAQQAVQNANNDRAAKLADAQHSVDNAQRDMVSAIASAQRDLDAAVNDMNARFGSAEAAVEGAQHNVQSWQNQVNDTWDRIHDCEGAPWYRFDKKPQLTVLYPALGILQASKAVADGVLQGVIGVLQGVDYIGAKGAIAAASGTLEGAKVAGAASLRAAQGTLQGVDVATQAAVDAANLTLGGVQQGGDFIALQGAIAALEAYKQANTAAFNAAVSALQELMKTGEYIAYQAASARLTTAKGATVGLEATKGALELARHESNAALALGKAIVKHGTTALDIRVVHLTGTLRGIIGAEGTVSKPLHAHVEGIILETPFSLDGEFDPRKTASFITSIFEKAWDVAKG